MKIWTLIITFIALSGCVQQEETVTEVDSNFCPTSRLPDGSCPSEADTDNSDPDSPPALLPPATPPTLTAVSIVSDNATNTNFARTGDTITLSFTSSLALSSQSVTILGQAAAVSDLGSNNYSATYTTVGTESEGAVPFSINFTATNGESGTAVSATTDASDVTFDISVSAPSTIALNNPAVSPSTDGTPELSVGGLEVGGVLELFSDACTTSVGTVAITGATQLITSNTVAVGSYTYYARQTDSAGNVSACSTVNIAYQRVQQPFVSVWTVPAGGTVNLPLPAAGTYNASVDWGDGSPAALITAHNDPDASHTYANGVPTDYTITISGTMTHWSFNNTGDVAMIKEVTNLGNMGWTNLAGAFYGATNLSVFNGGDTALVTDMSNMFRGATLVDPDVTNWDTSSVTDMSNMFRDATTADPDTTVAGPIWDTSSVTDMSGMFMGATSANPTVTNWDVSAVDTMENMFNGATSASPDITGWDFVTVNDMTDMFLGVTLATASYSNALVQMEATNSNSVPFHGGCSLYNAAGATARAALIADHTWAITDCGPAGTVSLTSVSISSNNGGSSSLARVGDVITVLFTADNPLTSYSATILGNAASVSDLGGNNYSATYTVAGGDAEGLVPFTIDFQSTLALGTQVTAVTDASSVTVDKTANAPSGLAMVPGNSAIGPDDTPSLRISGVETGASVRLYSDACTTQVASGTSAGASIDLTSSSLVDGTYTMYAQQTDAAGNVSACSVANFVYRHDDNAFTSVWQTTGTPENITLPLRAGFTYDFYVDWGDDSAVDYINDPADADRIHSYATPGTYTISITGTVQAWYFNNAGDKDKIYQVTNLGDVGWTNFGHAFSGCSNLSTFAGGDTSSVTDMRNMFINAPLVTPDTSGWDTSSVTRMDLMFRGASAANPDTSNWDTSSVTTMQQMFMQAVSANPDVDSFDTSSVTDMSGMFYGATSATPTTTTSGNIWNTSNVTNMGSMFRGATLANPDTSGWNTSNVTSMTYMFISATSANPDVSNWDVSSVTDMSIMFRSATSADPDMSSWNVGNVTTMNQMFMSVTLSPANYSNFLVQAEATSSQASVTLDGGCSLYNAAGATARAALIADHSWTITDCGPAGTVTLTSVSIASDNGADSTMAKVGDTITISFTASDTLTSTSATILGNAATMTNTSGNNWTATYVVASGDAEGLVPFTIDFQSTLALGTQVTAVTDASSVTIDKTANAPSGLAMVSPAAALGSDDTPEIQISGVENGATVTLYSDACSTVAASGVATGATINLISSALSAGSYTFYAQMTDTIGNVSACSVATVDYAYSSNPMVTTWRTTTPSETITLPLRAGYTYNFQVDWGDSSAVSTITSDTDPDITHTYAVAGDYTVTIIGTVEAWYFNNAGDDDKILEVTNLGDVGWVNLERAFRGCSLLTTFAGGNVSNVTTMNNMFRDSVNVTPDTSAWDTSSVTDMNSMFLGASSANPDVSNWDTSNVTDMGRMFYGATVATPVTSTSGNIWNTSNVTKFYEMFLNADAADPDVSSWDVSSADHFYGMFSGADVATPDTSSWVTTSATRMDRMFYNAALANPDTSSWDINGVTDMSEMFMNATSANPDMSSWDFSTVTDMTDMFNGVTLSESTYSAMLQRIEATSAQNNVTLHGGSSTYTALAGASRSHMTGTHSWTITDGGAGSRVNLTAISIISNNGTNTAYAITGDTVTLSFTADAPLTTSTVTIFGNPVTVNDLGGNAYNSTYTIQAGDSEGTTPFTIDYEAGGGVATGLQMTEADTTDASSVTVDRTANTPSIALLSPALDFDEDDTPEFTITNVEDGASVTLYQDACTTSSGSGTASGTSIDITSNSIGLGSYTFYARYTDPAGNTSSCAAVGADYERVANPMITQWTIPGGGQTLTLPLVSGYTYDFKVKWGDGTFTEVTSDSDPDRIHDYSLTTGAGAYEVKIYGTLQAWSFNNSGDKDKLDEVTDLADMDWRSFDGAFYGCSNLGDVLGGTTTNVTNMSNMFRSAPLATPDTSGWNTFNVTDMSNMFYGASVATPTTTTTPGSIWDTSNVTNMSGMFRNATNADPDTSAWDTANVTNMSYMFTSASSADPDTSTWDTSSVTTFGYMFQSASNADPDTSSWDTSSVTQMHSMFNGASIADPDVSGWETHNVTRMDYMFQNADMAQPVTTTSGNIWNTSNVSLFNFMFRGADIADPDVSGWDTASATNMSYMFYQASSADPDVSSWDVSGVTNFSYMFYQATSATLISPTGTEAWVTTSATNMSYMFYQASSADPDVSTWDVSSVTTMTQMFRGATSATLTHVPGTRNWNTTNVTNMAHMFNGASNANPDTELWDTSNVTTFLSMFYLAGSANPNTTNWDTSSVTNMQSMFGFANSADPDVSGWDTSSVTTMASMFYNNNNADPDVSGWDVSNVTSFSSMFRGATSIGTNVDFSTWDFASGNNFTNMFLSTSIPQAKYDALLIRLDATSPASGEAFHGGTSNYTSAGAGDTARSNLIGNGWTITDGGGL